MARPRKKRSTGADLAAQLEEAVAEKAALDTQLSQTTNDITALKITERDLKKKIRKADKKIVTLTARQAEIEALTETEAKKRELQVAIDQMIANGKSYDELIGILSK